MRIAILTETFARGGLESQVEGFVRSLREEGHVLSLIAGEGGRATELADLVEGRVLELGFDGNLTGGRIAALVRAIVDGCTSWRIDLLHLHPFVTLSLGAWAAAELEIPFVITLHGPASLAPQRGPLDRLLFDQVVLVQAGRVFCVSEELATTVRDIQPRARTEVLPNGVDLERWEPLTPVLNGPWALVTRLDPEKLGATKRFLESFAALPCGPCPVHVFGDGSSRAELEVWIERAGYADWVRCRGFSDDLSRDLAECRGAAGMARSLIETAATGLPVICAGYDGIKGLVSVEDMPRLIRTNFTGRGLGVIGPEELSRQLDALVVRPERFDLRPWIERNLDERELWRRYVDSVRNLPRADAGWRRLARRLVVTGQQEPLLPVSEAAELDRLTGLLDDARAELRDPRQRLMEAEEVSAKAERAAKEEIEALSQRLAVAESDLDRWRYSRAWKMMDFYWKWRRWLSGS